MILVHHLIPIVIFLLYHALSSVILLATSSYINMDHVTLSYVATPYHS